jgi:hypothetical protein
MNGLARPLTVGLVAVFALVMAAMPASAHSDKVYHGKDFASVSNGHLSGYVCDEERDGHDVWATWTSSSGGTWTASPHGAGTCDSAYFDTTVEVFQICETAKGCRTEYT